MQTGQADVGTPRATARSGGKREALCTVRGKTQSTVRRVASDAGVCKKSCSCVVYKLQPGLAFSDIDAVE